MLVCADERIYKLRRYRNAAEELLNAVCILSSSGALLYIIFQLIITLSNYSDFFEKFKSILKPGIIIHINF